MSVTLDQVRAAADDSYPVSVLDGCRSALLLFAGGFRGRNDGIHFADAGVAATCVDVDPSGLRDMEGIYPAGWRFVCSDVFPFVESASAAGGRWDVVSVDCPTNLFEVCAARADLWCALARRTVVLGCGMDSVVDVPDGWVLGACIHRSEFAGGVYWAVLESAA